MKPQTIVIDNFYGSMSSYLEGDMNSGLSNIIETFGNDPFAKPGNLTWVENATQIDAAGSVITDMILAGKQRVESGVNYVYCIGHTGRVYKIQVNDPTTFNPDYDNPVLLATLSSNTPTFTRGAFMDFYGTTERIYISHDKGVTRINFDGTSETFVGAVGTWTQNVPKPLKQFVGNLYIGNGTNIAEIDSTATVTTYTKLSPGFPTNAQVRDLDVTPDGNYLQIVVNNQALADITASTQDVTITAVANSWVFKWNGTDTGYTAFDSYPGVSLSTNLIYGDSQYLFGYDSRGVAIFQGKQRILSSGEGSSYEQAPFPNAVITDGSLATWIATLFFEDHVELSYGAFGGYDWEVTRGFWAPFGLVAASPETDVVRLPFMITASVFNQGLSSNGYTNNIFGKSKVYFSTMETSSAPTTEYKFYKWSPVTTGQGTALTDAVYQTQTQLFSKKIKVSEVRIYFEPVVANNTFQIDLIGSDGEPITGSTKTFSVGSSLTAGDDFAWYTPAMKPTYALGVRITNTGSKNMVFSKIEIDYTPGGK